MAINRFFCWVFLVAFTASACAMSRKKDQREEKDEDAQVPDFSENSTSDDAADPVSSANAGGSYRTTSGSAGVSGSNVSGGTTGSGGIDGFVDVCGNGKLEGIEECDDGNLDDRDGCTTLCVFTCDNDQDCDDLNDCNGLEICTDQHVCDDSEPDLEDGEVCGDESEDSSCWQGVCVRNACGDARITSGESCDDGNLDTDDGCTPDCEFTCESDSDCSGKDECLGDRVCEDHKCVGGEVLDDKTACRIVDERTKSFCGDEDVEKDGWCISGVCTCAGCGDGEVEGIEACDDGLLNGTDESPNNCSLDCQVVACGNGVLEGDEECDDGNHRRMDGCDSNCRYEFAHRFTDVEILKNVDIPKWCKHRNNRFADAFAEEVLIMGLFPFNALDIASETFSFQSATPISFYVLQVLDSNDTSMITADDEIVIGLYHGSPYDPFIEDFLDMPVTIDANQLDEETLLPAEYHRVPAFQAGGGRVLTSEPSVVELVGLTAEFAPIRDLMMQLVFDLSSLSRLYNQPVVKGDTIRVSEKLRLPELAGQNPMGLFCGAIGPQLFDQSVFNPSELDGTGPYVSVGTACCKNRGAQFGMAYRECDSELSDECETVAEMIRQGCTVCIEGVSDPALMFENQPRCELMKTNPESCFTIIDGIDYDIDSDGDGVNDSWSALFGFQTQRVRIYATL